MVARLSGREGVAAAALTLRWGSYLAVLLDQDKPVWPQVTMPGVISRISDQEMQRGFLQLVLPSGVAGGRQAAVSGGSLWLSARPQNASRHRALPDRGRAR